jgi:hypothetical protein
MKNKLENPLYLSQYREDNKDKLKEKSKAYTKAKNDRFREFIELRRKQILDYENSKQI